MGSSPAAGILAVNAPSPMRCPIVDLHSFVLVIHSGDGRFGYCSERHVGTRTVTIHLVALVCFLWSPNWNIDKALGVGHSLGFICISSLYNILN